MAGARRRKVALFAMLLGFFALAVGGTLLAITTGRGPRPGATTTTTVAVTTTLPSAVELGSVGEELDALIDLGRRVDYHAVYSVEDTALPEGLEQTVEVWRRGNQFRSDVVERDGGGTRRQSSISGGSVARACETVNGVETCNTVESVAPDLPAIFVNALNEDDGEVRLRARDEPDVVGYQARCFSAPDVGELCLATDGVMLRLVLQGATIEATAIEDTVPDAAFDTTG